MPIRLLDTVFAGLPRYRGFWEQLCHYRLLLMVLRVYLPRLVASLMNVQGIEP